MQNYRRQRVDKWKRIPVHKRKSYERLQLKCKQQNCQCLRWNRTFKWAGFQKKELKEKLLATDRGKCGQVNCCTVSEVGIGVESPSRNFYIFFIMEQFESEEVLECSKSSLDIADLFKLHFIRIYAYFNRIAVVRLSCGIQVMNMGGIHS